jgi:hypothetical protein
MRGSWRRKFVVLGAGLAFAGAAVVWWPRSGPPAPIYNGRPISELLDDNPAITQAYFGLVDAVGHLKGEAVPYLVHVLENEPTIPQRFYQNFFVRMPQSVRQHFPAPSFYQNRRGTCAALLGYTGSNGVAQISFLARLSKEDPSVRVSAMSALERLGPGSEYESVALEALLAATRDPDVSVAESGFGRLGAFRNRAAEVVPVLLKGLENANAQDECIHSLKVLGGTNEPLIKAAIDRGEADVFREHLASLQKRNATDEGVLR